MKTTTKKQNITKFAWEIARQRALELDSTPKAQFGAAMKIAKTRSLEVAPSEEPHTTVTKKAATRALEGVVVTLKGSERPISATIFKKADLLIETARLRYNTWGQFIIETMDRDEVARYIRENGKVMPLVRQMQAHYRMEQEVQATAY